MLAASDISSVPSDDVKNIISVIGFLILLAANAVAIMRGGQTQKREVSGNVTNHQAKEPAVKSDVDKDIKDLTQQIRDMRAEMMAQHNAAILAGQQRVHAITESIDTEIATIRAETSQRTRELHERITVEALKVSAHGAQIEDLKQTQHTHGTQIAVIQTKLPRHRAA